MWALGLLVRMERGCCAGIPPKQEAANQTILNTREIKLNWFQIHVNWEIFSIKLISGIKIFKFLDLIDTHLSLVIDIK